MILHDAKRTSDVNKNTYQSEGGVVRKRHCSSAGDNIHCALLLCLTFECPCKLTYVTEKL